MCDDLWGSRWGGSGQCPRLSPWSVASTRPPHNKFFVVDCPIREAFLYHCPRILGKFLIGVDPPSPEFVVLQFFKLFHSLKLVQNLQLIFLDWTGSPIFVQKSCPKSPLWTKKSATKTFGLEVTHPPIWKISENSQVQEGFPKLKCKVFHAAWA